MTIATPSTTTAPVVADPALDQAEQLLAQHDFSTAKKILVDWSFTLIRKERRPQRDRADFSAGGCILSGG